MLSCSLSLLTGDRLDKGSQENIEIPHILLASKDEDPGIVQDYATYLSEPGRIGEVETYNMMRHGWMGADNSLSTFDELQGYFQGYVQTLSQTMSSVLC